MGALPAGVKWIPEDDLLLKNAVEAGASLESLAKGAVCFSRWFTLQELQERWHSLLYDPDTSAEASARIIEFEVELSSSNPSKVNRSCNSKGKDLSSQKRKRNSLRSHYYAMRKRVCNGLCNSADLSFAVRCACFVTGSECLCGELLKSQDHQSVQRIVSGSHILNCYGGRTYTREQHVFPEMLRIDSSAADNNVHHSFHTEHGGAVEVELRNGIVGKDSLYGYTHNLSSLSVRNLRQNNVDQSHGDFFMQNDSSQAHDENLISIKSSSAGEETKQLHPVPTNNRYDSELKEPKPLPGYDSDKGKCDGFAGENDINLQDPNSRDSIDQFVCPSPATGEPIWGAIEDVNAPAMLADMHVKEKVQRSHILDDNKQEVEKCDAVTLQDNLNDGNLDAGVREPIPILDGDLMDFSSSYIDFADDGLIFIDVDGKDITDPSCLNGLSSILLSSPGETNQDDMDTSNDPKVVEIKEAAGVAVRDPETTKDYSDQTYLNDHSNNPVNISEANLLCTSSEVPCTGQYYELCTLNTIDTETPCNDHIPLPEQVLPQFSIPALENHTSNDNVNSASSTELPSTNVKSNFTVGGLTILKEERFGHAQPFPPSAKATSSILQQKVGLMHPLNGHTVGVEPSEVARAGVCTDTNITVNEPNACTSAAVSLHSAQVAPLKEECAARDLGKHGSFKSSDLLLEKTVSGSNHMAYYLSMSNGCKQEMDSHVVPQKLVASLASSDLDLQDPLAAISTSDQEERVSDADNDVPCFSDIEAMILEMDLNPYDQESRLNDMEVSRFQCLESKKALIRLEQCAESYMNRAILSHGAFAVLYGQHAKYFIRNPEVSLGRETEDVKVDIDLGKEGRANKISRRQAIIKMDEGGAFSIKNIGKCSIFINGKEVPANKRINLSSGSLVEIRDMRFIFEVNRSAVTRYIAARRRTSTGENTRFDFTGYNQ